MAKRYPKDLRARAVALCRRRRKLTETGAGPRSRRLDRNPLCTTLVRGFDERHDITFKKLCTPPNRIVLMSLRRVPS
jgi:hypothetical protein